MQPNWSSLKEFLASASRYLDQVPESDFRLEFWQIRSRMELETVLALKPEPVIEPAGNDA